MKKLFQSMFLACMFLTILLSGCAPALTPVPATSTPLPTETALPTKTATLTPTEKPTAKPTATTVPPTETPTITSTPDVTHYTKFTPEAATVNEAKWHGVSWKFVKTEVRPSLQNIYPGSKIDYTFPDGKDRVVIHFLGDGGILMKDLSRFTVYVKVTFSDGKSEYINEGVVAKGIQALAITQQDRNYAGWGTMYMAVKPIKDGLELVKVEIADNANQKDKAVVLYQK